MEDLNIEKFNPTKAEITTLVDKYKNLEIKGVEDKEGYEMVKVARKELGDVRVQIGKDGKLLRSEALKFQKAVIVKERELIALIEPTEQALAEKRKVIDEAKEMEKRKADLPERREKLDSIEYKISDEEVLAMDYQEFTSFFNEKYREFLEKKELKQREEQEAAAAKVKAEQKEAEAKLKADKDAAEAKVKADQEKLDADRQKIEDDRKDFEREKQHQKDLEKAKEDAAKKATADAERKVKEDKEAEEAAEKRAAKDAAAEQALLEKKKKYQDFIKKHDYEEGDANFYKEVYLDKIILYKKVGELSI